MGKLGLAINIAKRTANYVKTCGKESILFTKPQGLKGLQLEGLRLAPPMKADVCSFTKDPSLAPELLDSLLEVKGTYTEKAAQIVNRFLLAMGYKNPELVKFNDFRHNMDFDVNLFDGSVSLGKKEVPLKALIGVIRHELDHLDKFAKVVKAEGVETVEAALRKGVKNFSPTYNPSFDKDFWLKFSKDADITNFNSKKFLEAIENYRYDLTSGLLRRTSVYDVCDVYHLYAINEFEKSAYSYTKKVAKHFLTEDFTMCDIYGEPFGRIKNLMNKYAEKLEIFTQKGFEGSQTFDKLYCAAIARTEPAGIESMKYLRKVLNGEVPQDQEKLRQIAQELNAIEQRYAADGRQYLKVFDTVTDWLKEGKFTLNDIDLG